MLLLTGQPFARKKEKRAMKKISKIFACVLVLGLGLSVFAGCGCGGELSPAFDKEKLEEKAKEVITAAMTNGVESTMKEYMREDYLEDFPLEDVHGNLLSLQSESGEFLLFEKVTIRGEKSPEEGSDENFAIVLVTANFTEGDILFYTTFDEDMKVISFYVQ